MDRNCNNYGSSWCADFECDECPVRDLKDSKTMITGLDDKPTPKPSEDKHCSSHETFNNECAWCHATANEGIDWRTFGEPSEDRLLGDEEIIDYIDLEREKTYRDTMGGALDTIDVDDLLEAQDTKTASIVRAEAFRAVGDWLLMSDWEDEPTGIMYSQAIDKLRSGELPTSRFKEVIE